MMEPVEKGKELLEKYAFDNPEILKKKHSYKKDYYLPLNLGSRKIIIHYNHLKFYNLEKCYDRFRLLENQELRVTDKRHLYRIKGKEDIMRLNQYPLHALGLEGFSYLLKNCEGGTGYFNLQLKSTEVFYNYLYKLYMHNKDLFNKDC
ncbi:hypothetical protein [Lysinibacillus sp. 3P01SB]|uniref:hypothetical protein n=1 Tax=Lysinibacillus sp. 3P01SB TaxID=3132284 RepID=UPI0039A6E0C1